MRKPNVETFQFILDEQKISADTTLFLDDTPMHLEGAAQIGIHTVLVDAKHPIEKILEHF